MSVHFLKTLSQSLFRCACAVAALVSLEACETLHPSLQATNVCFPDGDATPPKNMSSACRDFLGQLIDIDSNESNDPGGSQKQGLVNALYFLLSSPTSLPLERDVFGVAPAKDFVSHDLLLAHEQNPGQPLHHILFDYIINSIRKIRIEPNTNQPYGGYYIALTQTMTLVKRDQKTFSDLIYLVATLIHEARHSAYWDHEIYCPQWAEDANACDWGTNKPHGWVASYMWSLIQSHRNTPLKPNEIQAVSCIFAKQNRYIYGLSKDWFPLGTHLFNENTYEYFPTLQQVMDAEGLDFVPRDYYSELKKGACHDDNIWGIECANQINALFVVQADPHWSEEEIKGTKQALQGTIQTLLAYSGSWEWEDLFFGIAPMGTVIDPALKQKLQENTPGFLVNHVLQSFDVIRLDPNPAQIDQRINYDFCNRTLIFRKPLSPCASCIFDLLLDVLEWARRPLVWPESKSTCKDFWGDNVPLLPCDKTTAGGYGWSTALLWGMVKKNGYDWPKQPITVPLVQNMCQRLKRIINLPVDFQSFRSMDCSSITYDQIASWMKWPTNPSEIP